MYLTLVTLPLISTILWKLFGRKIGFIPIESVTLSVVLITMLVVFVLLELGIYNLHYFIDTSIIICILLYIIYMLVLFYFIRICKRNYLSFIKIYKISNFSLLFITYITCISYVGLYIYKPIDIYEMQLSLCFLWLFLTIYRVYIIYIDRLQNNSLEVCMSITNAKKIIKICPYICYTYIGLFLLFLVVVCIANFDFLYNNKWITYSSHFIILFFFYFYIFFRIKVYDWWLKKIKSRLGYIVYKTKKKNFFNYIIFIFFQFIFITMTFVYVSNYYLIFILSLCITLGNILLFSYILTFKILSVYKIFFFIIILIFLKIIGFNPLFYFLYNFNCMLFNIEILGSIMINYLYELCYACNLFEFELKLLSLFRSCIYNIIEISCNIIQKVKLTRYIEILIKSLGYIYCIIGNYIVKMDPGNFSQGSGFVGNSTVNITSGPNNNSGPGLQIPNTSGNLHPINNGLNRLTFPLSPDRRNLIRTSAIISNSLGGVQGFISYDHSHNAFYINNRQDCINHRFLGSSRYITISNNNLYLILMKRLMLNGTVLPSEFVLVPIHLEFELLNANLNPDSISRGFRQENWGISVPDYHINNDLNVSLAIRVKNFNYLYDHLGPNPTLDNIKDALLEF